MVPSGFGLDLSLAFSFEFDRSASNILSRLIWQEGRGLVTSELRLDPSRLLLWVFFSSWMETVSLPRAYSERFP